MKGRPIWGALVPYDEVWRTGANEATTITFSTDVTVDGQPLAAGTYGLFTLPGKEGWAFVFNKGAKQWGAYEYKQADDVLRVKAKPREVPFTERMTFSFPNTTSDSTEVELAWEKLAVAFTVKVDVVGKVLADARKAMGELKADDWRTPARAAAFCADNNVSLDEAIGVGGQVDRHEPDLLQPLHQGPRPRRRRQEGRGDRAGQEGDRAGQGGAAPVGHGAGRARPRRLAEVANSSQPTADSSPTHAEPRPPWAEAGGWGPCCVGRSGEGCRL